LDLVYGLGIGSIGVKVLGQQLFKKPFSTIKWILPGLVIQFKTFSKVFF